MYQLSQTYPFKRAFITGAASGLGRCLAVELARDGWTLGLADLDLPGCEQTAASVASAGGKPFTYRLDVADPDNFRIVAAAFLQDAGGIDVLFNNAGVGDGGAIDDYPLENWHWMIGINQMGVVHGCHFFTPQMKRQRSGHIINVASIAGVACASLMGPYNMTKAAVIALSETLYNELATDQIRTSVVMPSFFKTNILSHARGRAEITTSARKLVDKSGFRPEEIAVEVLRRAGKGELYIVLPKPARLMWWMKRLSPYWFFKRMQEKAAKYSQRAKA